MNDEIKQAFLNALVARASYANLKNDMNEATVAYLVSKNATGDDANQSAMETSMANYFTSHFSVVDSDRMRTAHHLKEGSMHNNRYHLYC